MCGVWGFTPNLTHRSAWMDWIIYIKKSPHTSIRLETDNGLLLGVNLIFIIMDNTYISLKKILTTMIPEKYPIISEVKVLEYSDDYFMIYLGIKYSDLYGKSNDTTLENEISKYVQRVSKFITGNKDVIKSIVFFDNNHI